MFTFVVFLYSFLFSIQNQLLSNKLYVLGLIVKNSSIKLMFKFNWILSIGFNRFTKII